MNNLPSAMDQFERPDPVLTNKIVTHLKSQGIFDQFRRECMADVDTKPAYQNLRQRVEGSVAAFLKMNPWRPDMNKNQLRDNLRRHIQSGGFLDIGVDRIVDQVVNPKIYTVFLPKVEEVVQTCMGSDKDNPTFQPPPRPNIRPETSRFQEKHNLAPRARISASLTAPRMPIIPNIEALKPPQPLEDEFLESGKLMSSGSPDLEEPADENYVADEEDVDDNAEDDEESPPFEPHSESERLILGVRTDSSDSNSIDNEVVTTIVDDNLEEIIDNGDIRLKKEIDDKEEEMKKEEESSSDEYVPKTPTINMEASDGTVIEFNTISEYKQYQTKFDEGNFGDVEEEVVSSSQWVEETNEEMKEERNSYEEDSGGDNHKRKLDIDSFDDGSSSSMDKGSTSDEGKSNTFKTQVLKKTKLLEDNHEIETDYFIISHGNEDSNAEKSLDMMDFNTKLVDEYDKKSKSGSSSSKDSGRSHRHHSHKSNHYTVKNKEYREVLVTNSQSSKKDSYKKVEKHDVTRDKNKDRDRERRKSESSSKHFDRDSSSKYNEKDGEKRRVDKSETDKKKRDDLDKDKKESRHEHREKSRDHYHDKEMKKHDSHDKHPDYKKELESPHKHDKDKKESSKNSTKHSHSSSKHSHRSSSEKYKADKEHRHRESSDRHKSDDKKSEKDRHDSRKKQREHCKSSELDGEGRRSTDRDSNGPSEGRGRLTSSSRSTTSRTVESHTESSERTTSNSDNAVSDNIETEGSKCDSVSELGIASPDPDPVDTSWSESELTGSEWNGSKEEVREIDSESPKQSCCESDEGRNVKSNSIEDENKSFCNQKCKFSELDQPELLLQSLRHEEPKSGKEDVEIKPETRTDDVLQNLKENLCDEMDCNTDDRFSIPATSVHDTSSEKENIEQAVNITGGQSNSDNNSSNIEIKTVKFKKPKIAANIFEVKKIMQARRHLKRMEKRKLKLITKKPGSAEDNSTQEPLTDNDKLKAQDVPLHVDESVGLERLTVEKRPDVANHTVNENTAVDENPTDEKSVVDQNPVNEKPAVDHNSVDEKPVDESEKDETSSVTKTTPYVYKKPLDEFPGFEDVKCSKIETFNCLIDRLNADIQSALNNHQTDLNLITALIDVSPDLDDYIETVLKGKVHRKTRVRLPPISDKYYTFDPEQNVYCLIQNEEESPSVKENLVDGNLNNLSTTVKNQVLSKNSMTSEQHTNNTFNGSSSKSRQNVSKVTKSLEAKEKSIKIPLQNNSKKIDSSDKKPESNEVSSVEMSKNLNRSHNNTAKCGGPQKVVFSLTFNQTYDEILKEKEAVSKGQPEEVSNKTHQTVVKITNCKANEQVVVKTVKPNVPNKVQVPRITRSDGTVNGKISKVTPQRQPPLISRINKSKGVVAPLTLRSRPLHLNGVVSPDSTTNLEAEIADQIPQKICDVIGVQANVICQAKTSGVSGPAGEDCHLRESRQAVGLRQQQRYDSSDLYKPRLQLSSRRVRGTPPLPLQSDTLQIGTRRKRAASTVQVASTAPKRRR